MVEKETFDVAVIGAGPGGYVAAIRAAQLGKKVALIEKEYLGGTCLNVGCIPTKALLSHSQVLHKIKEGEMFGLEIGKVSFDFAKMQKRKEQVVAKLKGGLKGLIEANGITIFMGSASFISPSELKILGDKSAIISAKNIIIATGSEPIDIPTFPCDHERICNSTSILGIKEIPKSIVIIGGGYIGCEFASLFIECGVKITIIEALPAIVDSQGKAMSDALTTAFKEQGIGIMVNTVVESIEKNKKGLTIHLKGGEKVESEMSLVSVGRRLNAKNLGLEKIGVAIDAKGAITVNDKMETNIPGIYAIGDITAKAMLAHVASHQGIVAAENIAGKDSRMHYNAIPAVIFTHPEMASVGLTPEQAKETGRDVTVGTFPFQALGFTIAVGEEEGFAQIVADKKTGEILGAQVVGHKASILIGEITLAINNELTLECIIETIHAHPTASEGWLEAALLAHGTPIHLPPAVKKKALTGRW
jgi:dihydrolipoamide dehydrogenase